MRKAQLFRSAKWNEKSIAFPLGKSEVLKAQLFRSAKGATTSPKTSQFPFYNLPSFLLLRLSGHLVRWLR
jgi:hypothetical protein